MKGYENVPRTKLTPRMPMIIRVDGRAFHTYTRRFKEHQTDPWSTHLRDAMTAAAKGLMEEISGAKLAYIQSDEISVLVTDYDTFGTQAWFDKGVQKVCSVSASVATVHFNSEIHNNGFETASATFDSRCFVLPREEVSNYFVWRQRDAEKNSVAMLAQWYFSHKQLHRKNGSEMQDMLMLEKGINWNDLDTWKKRGWCVTRKSVTTTLEKFMAQNPSAKFSIPQDAHPQQPVTRTVVDPDWEIPIFSKDRDYVDSFVHPDQKEE